MRLGDPMISPRYFDLVITTTQYAVRNAANVLRLPITISNQDKVRPDGFEEAWLQSFLRPRRLLVIGGKTSLWRFDPDVIGECGKQAARKDETRRRLGYGGNKSSHLSRAARRGASSTGRESRR